MEYISLGTITKSFGIHGEAKVFSTTYYGKERYKKNNKVYLSKDGITPDIQLTINSYHTSGKFDIISFKEISTAEEIDTYSSYQVIIEKKDSLLKEGQYFFSDLEKCEIVDDETNKTVAKVVSVEEFPSQITLKCLSLETEKEIYVPFVPFFIKKVDINKKQIFIKVIPGLLWK